MGLVLGIVIFIFIYIFAKGAGSIDLEFLLESPRGAVLGMEGGIFPAIMGSLAFTLTAVVLGGIPAVATAVYIVFICKRSSFENIIRGVLQCIAGIPSIVLGLFAYSFLVRDLAIGRCILASSAALAVMIMPFIEARVEKSLREIPQQMLSSSYALGCSRGYTVFHIALPYVRQEIISALILGGCFAMGATPPLIFTGGVAFSGVPQTLLEPAMALPLHLYLLVAQGTPSLGAAYGTAFVMMAVILISNALATFYGRRRRWK
ncbi:MAG: ABC transporter permease subunit [Clostridia bacterium]|nr:ABC transporter permease subunit [Clostridia bacterium]